MQIEGKAIVVTGGARGIGAALCRRFAAAGASGVVIGDVDGKEAGTVAEEIGGFAVETDVGIEEEVKRLVEVALDELGQIDLFCSIAGVGLGGGMHGVTAEEGGPFASNEAWLKSWDVNVMGHVYAARHVLPAMVERGDGYLLNMASAAGLLTDMGAQAYSVTKHAAVAFAEWIAINYGGAGIKVSCVCPQGVRTNMLAAAVEAGQAAHLSISMIEPEDVAEAVIDGLGREQFLILPHPEVRDYFLMKATDYDRWIGGMRKLRRKLYGA